ncbi:MAG: hypothetical protein KatS3mg104_1560 [Phycisphaerae bacterium]|nr:MAG: hypothetical protein KatS3mg104_1560 [Phycisphaerae bacterium]
MSLRSDSTSLGDKNRNSPGRSLPISSGPILTLVSSRDLVTHFRQHPADLTITTFLDRDLKYTVGFRTFDQLDERSARPKPSLLRISQPDAFRELLDRFGFDKSVHDRGISLDHAIFWVCQLLGQLPVVGQQQKPTGLCIKTTHRINPMTEIRRQQVDGPFLLPLRDIRAINPLWVCSSEHTHVL